MQSPSQHWCHGWIFLNWNRPNYCQRSLIKSAVSRVDVHITPLTFQLHWYGNQKRRPSINGAGGVAAEVAGNPCGGGRWVHPGLFSSLVISSLLEMKWLWLLNSLRTKQWWGQERLFLFLFCFFTLSVFPFSSTQMLRLAMRWLNRWCVSARSLCVPRKSRP